MIYEDFAGQLRDLLARPRSVGRIVIFFHNTDISIDTV
jgi:hypothetical protein